MISKTPFRILWILAVAGISLIGFVTFRSRAARESQIPNGSPLKGLMLAENILLPAPYLFVPNPADGAVLKKKGVGPFLKPTDSEDLKKRLLIDIGAQLRKGGVRFVHPPPVVLGADGYAASPEISPEVAEQIEKQGSLSLTTEIEYINGIYFARCRLKLEQPLFLTVSPPSRFSATTLDFQRPFRVKADSAVTLIPRIRKTAAEMTDEFVQLYRTANGLPNPTVSGPSGGSIGQPPLGMVFGAVSPVDAARKKPSPARRVRAAGDADAPSKRSPAGP